MNATVHNQSRGALYPRAAAEASNDTMAKGQGYVLHKGRDVEASTHGAVPVATNFPRFKIRGDWPMLRRWPDANALVLNAVSSRGD